MRFFLLGGGGWGLFLGELTCIIGILWYVRLFLLSFVLFCFVLFCFFHSSCVSGLGVSCLGEYMLTFNVCIKLETFADCKLDYENL